MERTTTVRETPTQTLLRRRANDPTRPDASAEPELAINNIQGNILAGFNKDHQTHIYLRLEEGEAESFRSWLGALVPFIASTAEVLTFNRLFKEIRRRRNTETRTVMATWINVALSFRALESLAGDGSALAKRAGDFKDYSGASADAFSMEKFTDKAFQAGMAARSVDVLSDPPDAAAGKALEGNRHNWPFGGPGKDADVIVIVASDSPSELSAEVARIEDTIFSAPSGVSIINKQHGNTLPQPLTGHEHFGFLDGVSQPGVRGRISSDPNDVLTLRQNPEADEHLNQGKPGQDLLWPGEFVFGYSGQDPNATEEEGIAKEGPNSLNEAGPGGTPVGPVWAKDGSYLVTRRLRQDVAAFHKFVKENAPAGLNPGQLGAQLVGRWESGAPVIRRPNSDDGPLGDDDCANNHFEFQQASTSISAQSSGSGLCSDTRDPQSPGAKDGSVCPFASHIRKAYPRDDVGTLSPAIGEVSTQTHRLLRRGIPFGDPFYPAPDPKKETDTGNRGLLFACYQTSIEEQFEFVTQSWVNNPEFKDQSENGKLKTGHDLIIGQSNADGNRERKCVLRIPVVGGALQEVTITAPNDWVIPTGGGYFFAPSIDALCLLTDQLRK